MAPANLFWRHGTNFTNPQTMRAARQYADKLTAEGIVPASGAQRWEDTYEAALPASQFPGEPSWIAADRQNLGLVNKPEFQAWVRWQQAHSNLFMLGADGGQEGSDFRPWRGNWGHISPLMPLPEADWPADIKNAKYGDWYAVRWGQTAERSGAYGIMLSDFSDSQPVSPSYQIGFNPQVIAGFQAKLGRTIPGGGVPAKAKYINAHYYPAWNDYLAQGYADFYAEMANRLAAARHPGLIIDQCGQWPSARRLQGTDATIIAHSMRPANYLCVWDNQTMQVGRNGQPMIWGIGGMVIAAAREPNIRNGGNLSADDDAFWQAVAHFWGGLSYNDQHERGLKELKRVWLETAWSHIATRQGTVRRALAFMQRDYWDKGSLDAKVQSLVRGIVPSRPFGYALYYSTAGERSVEADVPAKGGTNGTYMNPNRLLAFKQGGGAVGYYVSNAGLPELKPAARPAAWLVLDNRVPDSELERLRKVAPVLRTVAEAKNYAHAPLVYSEHLSGMGFYDQNDRLIVTASNLSAQGLNGSIILRDLPAGTYVATDLTMGAVIRFTVAAGKGVMQFPITRWDTRAFAIKKA
ncbi:MAG TPA: hypothetical protein VH722_07695 [Alphaproteobacteria bacterium]|nr:hypothetical protein [Alphaproteobacteria bacterium]